jgi:hypothetical protein
MGFYMNVNSWLLKKQIKKKTLIYFTYKNLDLYRTPTLDLYGITKPRFIFYTKR